jgi:hypothetical protein
VPQWATMQTWLILASNSFDRFFSCSRAALSALLKFSLLPQRPMMFCACQRVSRKRKIQECTGLHSKAIARQRTTLGNKTTAQRVASTAITHSIIVILAAIILAVVVIVVQYTLVKL